MRVALAPHFRSPAMRSHSSPVFVLALGALTALVAQGCAQKAIEKPVEHTVQKVPAEAPEPTTESTPEPKAETEPGAVAKAKEDFERMLSRNLERLDEEIHEIQGKVAGLTDAAKAEWAEKMTELDAKRREAGERLEAVRKSTGEAWERLREGADKAWEELEQAVKANVKEF